MTYRNNNIKAGVCDFLARHLMSEQVLRKDGGGLNDVSK